MVIVMPRKYLVPSVNIMEQAVVQQQAYLNSICVVFRRLLLSAYYLAKCDRPCVAGLAASEWCSVFIM